MKDKAKNHRLFLLAAMVVLVTSSMRVPIGCVGPLIGSVQEDLSLPSGIAGFMTTIPMLIFAAAAPAAGGLTRATDNRVLLTGSVILCLLGVGVRSGGSAALLFVGTGLIGLSIGILNVLMPALIRQHFERVGQIMGLYSATMTASSAISAASCRSLAGLLGGWRGGMAVYAVFPAAALLLCLLCRGYIAPHFPRPEGSRADGRVWTLKNAAISVFMGLQSLLFFSLLTWYPSIIEALLPGRFDPGMVVLLMQAMSMVAAFFSPGLADRVRRRGLLCFWATCVLAAGFAALALWGGSPAGLLGATVLIGLGCGSTMSLALNLMTMQGKNAAQAAGNAAFIQCFSYLLAALGPTGFGFVYDRVGSWSAAIGILIAISLLMALTGLYAGRREKP